MVILVYGRAGFLAVNDSTEANLLTVVEQINPALSVKLTGARSAGHVCLPSLTAVGLACSMSFTRTQEETKWHEEVSSGSHHSAVLYLCCVFLLPDNILWGSHLTCSRRQEFIWRFLSPQIVLGVGHLYL